MTNKLDNVKSNQIIIGRRDLLRTLVATGTGMAINSVLPYQWLKPIVEAGVLPAHAQTSLNTLDRLARLSEQNSPPNNISSIEEQPNLKATSTRLRRGVDMFNIKNYDSWRRVRDMKMDVVYHYLGWDAVETKPGYYNWAVVDDILWRAKHFNLKVILRIYNAPAWYTIYGSVGQALAATDHHVKTYTQDRIREFMRLLTNYVKTSNQSDWVAGYVIWNEPNIIAQWGAAPNALAYMELLKPAYAGAKMGDPNAVIVSAPLAPTADKTGIAINDLTYLGQLYDNGLVNYVDYVGMIGLGFQYDPDYDTGSPAYNFMRLKYLHDVMLTRGDLKHKAWALEVGWLRDGVEDMGEFNQFKVSEMQQAEYLVWAFKKAETEWASWMDLMTIWNLDFNLCVYPSCPANFRYYSIANTIAETYLKPSNNVYLPLIMK